MKNLYEQIERYLQGELPEIEQFEFEEALKTDTNLAKSVAQHRELIERLETLRLRKKVKKALAPSRSLGTTYKPFFTSGVIGIIVTSLFIFAAALWLLTQKPDAVTPRMIENQQQVIQNADSTATSVPQETVQNHLSPSKSSIKRERLLALAREFQTEPPASYIRDTEETNGPSSAKTPNQMASGYFQKGNYTMVAELLRADEQVAGDEKARFLRAHSRFRIGQYVGAASDFEALNNSFRFKHDARWNYLLCQLAMGKIDKVNALLNDMISEPDFPFHKNAVALKEGL